MKKFKSIMVSIFGDIEQTGSERYFLTFGSFIIPIFLLLMCSFHYILGLKTSPVFLACFSSVVIAGLYFLARFGNSLNFAKVFLTLFGLTMLDYIWYTKYLSNGPVLFLILIFGALILWIWERKTLTILLTIYFLNFIMLFVIDYNAPETLFKYPDLKIRSIDIYLSLMFYSSLMI